MIRVRQFTKLEKRKTTNTKIQSHYSPVEAIVNISKRQLTTPENLVLNKGLNFATTIKRIPYLDLIAPIFSNRGSTCHPMIRFLVEIIKALTGKSSSYVKNSAHFVERISDAPIHSNKMVSLDVMSRFTNVPTDETLAVVRDKLAADPLLEKRTCIPIDNLMEMLTFCVETTYFGMGSDMEEEGLAMGSPLSPVLANIYMKYFEEMALGSTSLKPSMWLRYIDDTFILCPHQEDVQILFDHVNSIRPSIHFTMEKEQDNKLPILDVLVTRTEQGFRSSVYCKPTFTRQYLKSTSFVSEI